jgi:anti-sigma-K factor RskA
VLVLGLVFAGGYWAWQRSEPLRLTSVATIAGAQGPMLWSIQLDARHERLRAVALAGAAARPGHSFELWALLPGKAAPVSLGVLPDTGQRDRTLSAAQQAALLSASQLAVSLEPPGGSPTGAPTGPVLFVAALKIPA